MWFASFFWWLRPTTPNSFWWQLLRCLWHCFLFLPDFDSDDEGVCGVGISSSFFAWAILLVLAWRLHMHSRRNSLILSIWRVTSCATAWSELYYHMLGARGYRTVWFSEFVDVEYQERIQTTLLDNINKPFLTKYKIWYLIPSFVNIYLTWMTSSIVSTTVFEINFITKAAVAFLVSSEFIASRWHRGTTVSNGPQAFSECSW